VDEPPAAELPPDPEVVLPPVPGAAPDAAPPVPLLPPVPATTRVGDELHPDAPSSSKEPTASGRASRAQWSEKGNSWTGFDLGPRAIVMNGAPFASLSLV
jgi:hypothetical protein